MSRPIVHVLTHCVHPILAYGSLLVFDSIRTGYPTADIEVFDNGSCAEMIPRIEAAARSVGATFTAMPLRHYSDHWRWNLLEREWPDRPVVFLDADVVLWGNCEQWEFGDALMAGWLMPERRWGHTVEHPRLHPSHLWVPSIRALAAELARRCPPQIAGHWHPIGPVSEWRGSEYHRHDTLAPLFWALDDRCEVFGEAHLDQYTHLFYGAHLPHIQIASGADVLLNAHRAAVAGDVASLRGIWPQQQRFFEEAPPPRGKLPEAIEMIRSWHREEFDQTSLENVLGGMGMRLTIVPGRHHGRPRPKYAYPAPGQPLRDPDARPWRVGGVRGVSDSQRVRSLRDASAPGC
ncbi:MAG: hypothetical protein ACTHL8_05350 [Burkholderiaceae bacterium]